MNWLKTSVVACVNLLLPPRCPLSGVVVDRPGMVSAESWAGLVFISSPHCSSCGLPFEVDVQGTELETLCGSCLASPKPYHRARSVLAYNDDSRKLILAFKHGDQTHLTLSFGPWLQSCGKDVLAEADALVPVPLHWVRLVKRRYNQSALLGEDLRRRTGIPHWPDVLRRERNTPTQGHQNASRSPCECSRCFLTQPSVSRESSWKKLGFA
jgi:predicted amidophosphoribosyltransferase